MTGGGVTMTGGGGATTTGAVMMTCACVLNGVSKPNVAPAIAPAAMTPTIANTPAFTGLFDFFWCAVVVMMLNVNVDNGLLNKTPCPSGRTKKGEG